MSSHKTSTTSSISATQIDNIDIHLKNMSSNPGYRTAREVIIAIVGLLGISPQKYTFIIDEKCRRYDFWFSMHPIIVDSRATERIHHISNLPIEIKIYHLQKFSISRIKGAVHFTDNYEDSDRTREGDKHIGIDFFVHPKGDTVTLAVSNHGNIRTMTFSGKLSRTQRDILSKWIYIPANLPTGDMRKYIHTTIWDSCELKAVNTDFYKMIESKFHELSTYLVQQKVFDTTDPYQTAKEYTNRFFSRILFIWFLRKKTIIAEDVYGYFDIEKYTEDTLYYKEKLSVLFFDVLNTPQSERVRLDADIHTPYLNGGLFQKYTYDIDSMVYPDGYFKSLYAKLDEYNFTTEESSSDYQQVAIDPEMLGRIFENLLASMNPETGENARKANGAFYTPREIVDYMCRESLRQHLYTHATTGDIVMTDKIDSIIDTPDYLWENDKSNITDTIPHILRNNIRTALDTMQILDPACGSGAYPIGMLQAMLRIYMRIDRDTDEYKKKKTILEKNIYGVDKDPIAIDISRLRAFLALIVDQEYIPSRENGGIDTLPNLDFKFVCANTLIPIPIGLPSTTQMCMPGTDAFLDTFGTLVGTYYSVHTGEKKKYWDDICTLIYTKVADMESELANMNSTLGGGTRELSKKEQEVYTAQQTAISQIHSYLRLLDGGTVEWFDPRYMYGICGGFDVVIGNPPYVQLQKFARTQVQKDLENVGYKTFEKAGDLYCIFYERGIQLSKKNTGILSYITSNKWMRAGYGKSLREYFTSLEPLILIDCGPGIFESATVDTNILILRNRYNKESV